VVWVADGVVVWVADGVVVWVADGVVVWVADGVVVWVAVVDGVVVAVGVMVAVAVVVWVAVAVRRMKSPEEIAREIWDECEAYWSEGPSYPGMKTADQVRSFIAQTIREAREEGGEFHCAMLQVERKSRIATLESRLEGLSKSICELQKQRNIAVEALEKVRELTWIEWPSSIAREALAKVKEEK
jgi:hypothetical protein